MEERGLSSLNLIDILWRRLVKEQVHLVIALDDSEVLLKIEGPKFLYEIARKNDEMGRAYGSISVIATSNIDQWEFMDLPMACMFNRSDTIYLQPLIAREILVILQSKAMAGLRPNSWDQEILQYILKVSNGDFRTAFITLISAAHQAEVEGMDRITTEHVDVAISFIM